jgi:hypothetical protein
MPPLECRGGPAWLARPRAARQANLVDDRAQNARFFDALMAKHFRDDPGRPRGFFPRLDQVTVYALTTERITGNATPTPDPPSPCPSPP